MTRALAFLAAVAAVAAAPALADHLHPSPSVRVDPLQPPRPPIDFSPAPDPFGGAFRGMVVWTIACPGAERFGYSINFVDVASGSYGLPPAVERRRSATVPFFQGSGFTTSPSGAREVRIPPGSAVFPHIEARCYAEHVSERVQVDGSPIYVPPYVWYPLVRPDASRSLSATRPVVLRRGRTVTASIRVSANPQGEEGVRLFVAGAGVKIARAYAPSRRNASISIRFRPTKRGVVRIWALLQPYGTKSNVVGLRVR